MTETTFAVTGMSCDHCVRAVREEVGRVDGVVAVDVQLDGGLVTVTSEGEVDPAAVVAAVEEAGYEVSG